MLKPSCGCAERDAVAVGQPRAALLLAVDQDLAVAVQLLELEVAAVEDDLRVVCATLASGRWMSLPSARPSVVTGLCSAVKIGGPSFGK